MCCLYLACCVMSAAAATETERPKRGCRRRRGSGAAAPGKVLRFKRLGSSVQVVVGHVCVYHVCVCGPGEVLEVVVGDEPGLEARVQDRRGNPARDPPH